MTTAGGTNDICTRCAQPIPMKSRDEMTSFDKIIKSLQSSLKAVQESPAVSVLDRVRLFVFEPRHLVLL